MNCMSKIFHEFDKEKIQYIHFKSNCHLDDSFLGDGDFDILIDSQRLYDVERILSSNNGKRFNSFYYGRYPGVDNWLIFDEETGNIKHFHLHCQLATGKAQVKEYVIPWADIMLATRTLDSKWGIYITDPNIEILLLMMRSIVKSTIKDIVKAVFNKYSQHKDLKEEWAELHKVIDYKIVDNYVDSLFPLNMREEIKAIVRVDALSSKDFRKLNRIVRDYLRNFRRYNGFISSLWSIIQKAIMKFNRYKNYHFDSCHPIKKTGLSGGMIIAFVGVDGSGKSSTTKEIQKWLQKKIECHRFYMGEGDGKSNLFVKLMKKLRVANTKKQTKDHNSVKINKDEKILYGTLFLKKWLRSKMILSLEKNNYNRLIRMNKYRLNGGISLLDRYPQIEFSGRNDGPKLIKTFEGYKKNNWINKILAKEWTYLSLVKTIKPDIVFRLNITAEESMRRKPEQTNICEFQSKIDDLTTITFQDAKIIDIDATQPYNNELMEIKKVIWSML